MNPRSNLCTKCGTYHTHMCLGLRADPAGAGDNDTAAPSAEGCETLPSDLKPVDEALEWLDAALKCKDFHWDGDQREAAQWALDESRRIIPKSGVGRESPSLEFSGWTKEPPTKQGEYWHWNGEDDTAPYIYHILWSGSANKCFVSIGQYGITEASFCDQFGGWWKKIDQPRVPDLHGESRDQGHGGKTEIAADSAVTDALLSAAQAVVDEALEDAETRVHICDRNDDEIKARAMPIPLQLLYRAVKAFRLAKPSHTRSASVTPASASATCTHPFRTGKALEVARGGGTCSTCLQPLGNEKPREES